MNFQADYLLTAFLMISAPYCDNNTIGEVDYKLCKSALISVAEDLEIISDVERNYMFVDYKNFDVDLNSLRARYEEFKDAPPAADALRLPDSQYIRERERFNRTFREKLVKRKNFETHLAPFIDVVIRETDRLYVVWDTASFCRNEYTSVVNRRRYLVRLKNLLGEEDYNMMKLPPCVPIWRFEELEK